jgi:hypothetical protein
MDSLNTEYRDVIEKILKDYANFIDGDDQVQVELVFDRERDRYLLIETGWQDGYRIYGTLLHIDLIANKLWIQHDGTEEGIAVELVAAGIPKEHIVWVLGQLNNENIQSLRSRKRYCRTIASYEVKFRKSSVEVAKHDRNRGLLR